ncbi:cupin domain-containing protein [Angustibacter sp. Root456]|uniref:cupin domain-containing protein n=1 Tax=Angustibacter sp. Root456 TaxID=1736539 RepID=UPI0006F39514|nr:cupin domain-containing protein [Angustibacter sp. Root456]KQX62865.1 hypothetical protein ASD06_12655 [Angustibacter sp. Root456]
MPDLPRVVCADVPHLDLGAPATDALACADRELATHAGVSVGLWEAGPGVDTDIEVDELFVVLSGAGTVTFDDGSSVQLRPGALVRLHAGERTRWEITERLRKLYVA